MPAIVCWTKRWYPSSTFPTKAYACCPEEVLTKLANGEEVNPGTYYFKTIPTFETAKGKYDWLMRSLFIANGIRNPANVVIQVWKVC